MALRRGFKSDAETLALDQRRELGISPLRRLNPLALADFLAIPVWTLTQLATETQEAALGEAIGILRGSERAAMSALTVFRNTARVIVHNDAHSPARQASNITHELAHGLLWHEPRPALSDLGCRDWSRVDEDEANYLAGALLVPAKAAWGIAKRRQPLIEAAATFGCSEDMIRWRVNITGAGRLLRKSA